jgi:hypothetical protein
MSAMVGGGYGEKRETGRDVTQYDPLTGLSRERAFSLFSAPETIPSWFSGTGVAGGAPSWAGGFEAPNLGVTNQIIGQLRGLGTEPTGAEMRGAEEVGRARDLGSILAAQRGYYGAITTPRIQTALQRAGQGRSGAEAEAMALAGAAEARPLTELANLRQLQYGQLLGQLGTAAAGRQLEGLRAAGPLAGQTAVQAAQMANQYNIAMNQAMMQAREQQRQEELGLRRQYFANLLQALPALETGKTFKKKQTGWDVSGQAGYKWA